MAKKMPKTPPSKGTTVEDELLRLTHKDIPVRVAERVMLTLMQELDHKGDPVTTRKLLKQKTHEEAIAFRTLKAIAFLTEKLRNTQTISTKDVDDMLLNAMR